MHFMLTIGSFLLTEELFQLQLCVGNFWLTIGALLLTAGVLLGLQLGLSRSQ